MEFHAGQEVVCIDCQPLSHPTELPFVDPVLNLRKGAVYTVREYDVTFHSDDNATLRLEEIQGPILSFERLGRWEVGFSPSRFRPVQTTNIDVFRRILEPSRA